MFGNLKTNANHTFFIPGCMLYGVTDREKNKVNTMPDKARLKAELYTKEKEIEFIEEDITRIELPQTGAFVLNYTLQFVRPVLREYFLQRIFDNLRPGGVLILGEKIISHDPLLNRVFIELYHRYKRDKGYS